MGPAGLRAVTVRHWGFDGAEHDGLLIVAASVAEAVERVFARLHAERFPIRTIRPVSEFAGDDDASMAADNTSAFNCRPVKGTSRWSQHSYGTAIDVNPVENPYVRGGAFDPPAGAEYADRRDVRPGMAVAGGALVAAFDAAGWRWGGRWSSPDHQHFSATGR